MSAHRIFLLSPASVHGERAAMLFRPDADFDLVQRLRRGEAQLGETFAFISGLYFRGKLTYARRFAAPPEGIPGAWIVTSGLGLLPPETSIALEHLAELAAVPIDAADRRYRDPLEKGCRLLHEVAGDCEFVLLGSVATVKYLEPMFRVFGEQLLFPREFIGRGDMSRGGLMLRSARAGEELEYTPLGSLTRHGPRPPKLPKRA